MHICQNTNCQEEGVYPAPKWPQMQDSPTKELLWFCLPHVREYNKSWNFFSQMDDDEVLTFQKEAATGHRPTKRIDGQKKRYHFNAEDLLGEGWKSPEAADYGLNAQQKKALETLQITYPFTKERLQRRYKELAKRYHPDKNPETGELFRRIVEAYQLLKKTL